VALVERGRVGEECSGAGAGMLAAQAEAGEESPLLDLALASRGLYRGWATALAAASGVDPEYTPSGIVRLASGRDAAQRLEARGQWQRRRGLRVETLTRAALDTHHSGLAPGITMGLRFADDHRVRPERLMVAAARAATAAGVAVLERTEVIGLDVAGGRLRGVRTTDRTLAADLAVLAAGCWSGRLAAGVAGVPDTEPIRGQMVLLASGRRESVDVLFGDHCYLVPRGADRVLVGATMEKAGFDANPTATGIDVLLSAAAELRPSLLAAEVLSAWAGLRPGTPDGLPSIGFTSLPGLMLATGHLRNGLLLAPATALLVADLACGRTPRFAAGPFAPQRHRIAAQPAPSAA